MACGRVEALRADGDSMTKQFFFDSHGGLHVSCGAEEPGAGAFGPTGVSRRVHNSERVALRGYLADTMPAHVSDFVALQRHIVLQDDWQVLDEKQTRHAITWRKYW